MTIAREIGARWLEAVQLGNLASAYRALGQVGQAIKGYEEALAIAREIGDRRKESLWIGNLGRVYCDLGQIERAINLYEEALVIARETGDRRAESNRLGDLGNACCDLGQVEQAVNLCREALTIIREIGCPRLEVVWLSNLGNAYRAMEQIERAIKLYEEALTISHEIGYCLGQAYQLLELGRALLATGELSDARRCCAEARALDVPETGYQAALALGIVLLHQRDSAAGEAFADAAARCQARQDLYGARYALAAALVGQAACDPRWAQVDERAGLLAPAQVEYRRALEICAAPGAMQDARWHLEMIRAAGVEGLEPAFELLESARGENTDRQD